MRGKPCISTQDNENICFKKKAEKIAPALKKKK